uniref:Uncharacterized protein n=1 Tax=viral metagenome TaxID=1070528 RepID=A0A6M3LXF4_9ZZZZ
MAAIKALILRLRKYRGTLGDEQIRNIDPGSLPPFLKDDVYPILNDTLFYLEGIHSATKLTRKEEK